MDNIDIQGCPAPQKIRLIERLKPLIGKTVTVFGPGMPQLSRTTGKLTKVTPSFFIVGSTKVVFKTSFFIVLRSITKPTKPFNVTATAEGMGVFRGKLLRVGKDFVEFVQVPGRDNLTIFPLNLFTGVICRRKE